MSLQHSPHPEFLVSHLPVPLGAAILVWKDWVQARRRLDIGSVASWLAVFGLSVGMILAGSGVTLVWVFIIWGLLIGQVCTKRLRSDLSSWVLFRQLPFSSNAIILTDIASSVVGATVLCWLAYILCSLIGWKTNMAIVILVPGLILCLALTASFDIHRQSKTDALLAGYPARMGSVGVYLGLIVAGLPLTLVTWLSRWTGIALWITSLFGLLISLAFAYLMWQLAANQLNKIK